MGLNIGRLVSGALRVAVNPLATLSGASLIPSGSGQRTAAITTALPALIGAINPAAGAAVGALMPAFSTAMTPSSGGDVVIPEGGTIPGVTPAMGVIGGMARMTPLVFNAIIKLSQRLGGAGRSAAAYGSRVWGTLSAWAAKNPGVSLISLLVSLGLTVEEAAHFIAWGTTHKKRKRGRGITGRDLRTTRRTVRKVLSMHHMLRELCGGARPSFARAPRRHRHQVVSLPR